jgi:uncharacterized protein YodC (DUF2158 family)
MSAELRHQLAAVFDPPETVGVVPGIGATSYLAFCGRHCVRFEANTAALTFDMPWFSERYIQPAAKELFDAHLRSCGNRLVPPQEIENEFRAAMAEADWKPERGDTVWLASGSPPLTVYLLSPEGFVEVKWFAGPEVRRDAFHIDCLRNFLPEATKGYNGSTFSDNLVAKGFDD